MARPAGRPSDGRGRRTRSRPSPTPGPTGRGPNGIGARSSPPVPSRSRSDHAITTQHRQAVQPGPQPRVLEHARRPARPRAARPGCWATTALSGARSASTTGLASPRVWTKGTPSTVRSATTRWVTRPPPDSGRKVTTSPGPHGGALGVVQAVDDERVACGEVRLHRAGGHDQQLVAGALDREGPERDREQRDERQAEGRGAAADHGGARSPRCSHVSLLEGEFGWV